MMPARGSGTTTLAELLVRFLDPDEGRVLVPGTAARDIGQDEVRQRISLDGQDAYGAAKDRTVLLITHREDEAALTRRVLRLRRGRITPEVIRSG